MATIFARLSAEWAIVAFMFWIAGIGIDLYSVDLIVHYVFYNASKLMIDSIGLLLASPP